MEYGGGVRMREGRDEVGGIEGGRKAEEEGGKGGEGGKAVEGRGRGK